MPDRPQTLTATCSYCNWLAQDHAMSEQAAVGVADRLRGQLLAHVEQAHAAEIAGPPPADAPKPPPPPLSTPTTPQDELKADVALYRDALRRIKDHSASLAAARKVARDALQGVARPRAWNRSSP